MSSNGSETKENLDVPSKMSSNDKSNEAASRIVTKTIVTSPNIYKPIGPYSQAVLADKTLYVSGVLGLDEQGQLVCGGAEAQTRKALDNLQHVLAAGGASLESVVYVNILLSRMEDFQIVNKVYGEYFKQYYPARAAFQAAKLPLDAAVEIVCTALSGNLVVNEAGPCPCSKV